MYFDLNTMKKRCYCLLFAFTLPLLGTAQISLTHLTVEGRNNYRGLDDPHPRFGWQISSSQRNVIQKSFRIRIASSKYLLQKGKADVWDSGTRKSSQSQWVDYMGPILLPNEDYFWQVEVCTNQGKAVSPVACWSMGLLSPSNWRGDWIGSDSLRPWESATKYSRVSARYLRKTFRTRKQVVRAVVHVCGLGLYTLRINGDDVGQGDVLTPVGTDFDKHVAYDTYDVTNILQQPDGRGEGCNALLLSLEAGNYFAMRQQYQTNVRTTYGLPRARLNLLLQYADGTSDTLVTDSTWRLQADGPVRWANYYDGECYDARKEMGDASLYSFDDSRWEHAQVVTAPRGDLIGNITPNMHVYATDRPVKLFRYGRRTILDFGTNGAGRLRIRLQPPEGDTITLRFAEQLSADGHHIYMENLRSALCSDLFIGDGKMHDFVTDFVYHGFRYAEISGCEVSAEFIHRELIADRMDDTGYSLTTGNAMLDSLLANARRGIRSNYKGMPIDCPQRDERMPWLGDRTLGCLGESYLMDNRALYAKWICDICDSQRPDGNISDVSPAYWRLYTCNITWPAALPFSADMLFRQYGDLRPMQRSYSNTARFLRYMRDNFYDQGLITRDKYGDWCVPPEDLHSIHSKDSTRVTDGSLIASSYYYYLCRLMARYAGITGHGADSTYYYREASTTREALNRRFFHNGHYANGTVTANLLPLAMDIVEEKNRGIVNDSLLHTIIVKNHTRLGTGVIGIQWLMRYLARMGRDDLAWQLATTEDYPSWGYMLRKGATTIWELWNGDTANPAMNSGNHVMLLGDLLPWSYEIVGGIRPLEPGFRCILLAPDFNLQGTDGVTASHTTPYGIVSSAWKRTNGKITWKVTVPPNTQAELHLPDGSKKIVGSGNYIF